MAIGGCSMNNMNRTGSHCCYSNGVWIQIAVAACVFVGSIAQAQDRQDTGSRSTARAGQAAPIAVLPAVVIEVGGTVDRAKSGVSPLASEGWIRVKVEDRLQPGTQIRTGLRSYVNLQFGETTVIAIRSATHAGIDQIYRSATAEHIQLGLAYGTVRGGSVEGKVHSDVVVDSTVATLAKRGTEGWEMHVEPMTGRFRISLAEHGLIEAIKKLQGDRTVTRTVRPGEYATDVNIANMWIKQDIFDRNVKFYQADAVTVADADFTAEHTRGYGVLAPGGGSTLVDASGRVSSDFVLEQIAESFPSGTLPPTTVITPTEPVERPEGHFGTGQTFRILLPQSTQKTIVRGAGAPKVRRHLRE